MQQESLSHGRTFSFDDCFEMPQTFIKAMQSAGFNPPDTIQPGKFYRFPGIGKKRGDDSGWCRLFDDELGGVFGDFSSGFEGYWQARSDRANTTEERQAFQQFRA